MSYDPSRYIVCFIDSKSYFTIYINENKTSKSDCYIIIPTNISGMKDSSKFIVSKNSLLSLIKMSSDLYINKFCICVEDFDIEKYNVDIENFSDYLCLLSECKSI